jgi:hypothetical protein
VERRRSWTQGPWKITNGILENQPPTYNPVSKEKFKDFKIEAEFKLDQDQNSGLYLRGRHELQLSLGMGNPATNGRRGLSPSMGGRLRTSMRASPPASGRRSKRLSLAIMSP